MTSESAQTLETGAQTFGEQLDESLSALQLAPSVPWAKRATASCIC